MKISLNWLKDYVKISLPPQKLAHRLTMAGLEVEKIEDVGGDTVFELEITPNRPDCLNMIGLAREASAILNVALKKPKTKKVSFPKDKCDISILDKEGCSRYIGTVIQNVKIGESPDWLKKRLQAIGLRPINNVVDITNFCLFETGQPLHAFDYDKLEGGKIIVRRAREGEKITTLDDVARTLNSSTLVIADSKNPVALAGVMGGEGSEVTSATKTILLESAYFNPVLIRRAGRSLGISSDSSYRFERGVDIDMVEGGSLRAVSLILEVAGGEIVSHADIFPQKTKIIKKQTVVSLNSINQRLGANLTLQKCKTVLKKLEFQVTADRKHGTLKLIAPSFRNDIHEEVDISEEAARVIGYDHLPASLPSIPTTNIPTSPKRVFKKKIAEALRAQGLNEAITYTMVSGKLLQWTQIDTREAVKVKNPLSLDQEYMRPSLLPSLLSVVLTNFNLGQKDLKLFELGKVYAAAGEEDTIGIVMTGRQEGDWRKQSKGPIDFYDLKGSIDAILTEAKIEKASYAPAERAFLESRAAATVTVNGKEIGVLGKVNDRILQSWDIKQKNVFFAQLNLDGLFQASKDKRCFAAAAEFPSSVRDISLAVKNNTTFDRIKESISNAAPEFLTGIKFIGQYLGEGLPAGHRGITISLTYQSPSRTLREEEIAQAHEKICQTLTQELGAVRR